MVVDNEGKCSKKDDFRELAMYLVDFTYFDNETRELKKYFSDLHLMTVTKPEYIYLQIYLPSYLSVGFSYLDYLS